MADGHALKGPDRRGADAAGAAETMHDLAIDQAAPLSRRTACRDNGLHNTSGAEITKSTADDDSHTSVRESTEPVIAQPRQASLHTETTLAHRAALNRTNAVNSKKPHSSDKDSGPSSQPVLVTPYSGPRPGPAKKVGMGKRRRPSVESSELPPLESFSFHDILKQIDPDINFSVDAIAEIYGRSKLSLADEYESHRPPLGKLDSLASPDQSDFVEASQSSRLEPVEESTRGHSRCHSLALVGTSAQPKCGLSSNAIAETSHTTSVPQQKWQSESAPSGPQADTQVALLPYILSWLRNSNARGENPPAQSSADSGAAESLHRILGDNR